MKKYVLQCDINHLLTEVKESSAVLLRYWLRIALK